MRTLRTVFGDWRYLLMAAAISAAVFAAAVWFPNLRLLALIWGDAPLADAFLLSLRLLKSITTNFTLLSALYTAAISLLIGVNVALITYVLRRRARGVSSADAAMGTAGVIAGAAGIGCAACGSLLVASILASVGGAGLLALLPFQGGEFGILGVALLGTVTYRLTRHIGTPAVCEPITTP